MKLLFIGSGHPLASCDMCLMWDKLGLEWFDTSYYNSSDQPGDLPYIKRNLNLDPAYTYEFNKANKSSGESDVLIKKNKDFTSTACNNIFLFNRRFIQIFDTIVISHVEQNLRQNAQFMRFGRQKIIFHSFGMGNSEDSIKRYRAKGMLCVRNSPTEYLKFGRQFGGSDAIIRGGVVRDEHEISGWTGQRAQVITFTNNFDLDYEISAVKRKEYYKQIKNMCSGINFKLYGAANKESSYLPHQEKVKILQNSRVNLVTGTPGSNMTYSCVESLVMGMPTVVFGQEMWQSPLAYEPKDLITHGEDGFLVSTPAEAADIIKELMNNFALAKQIGDAGRKRAIQIYGRDILANQWKEFLGL